MSRRLGEIGLGSGYIQDGICQKISIITEFNAEIGNTVYLKQCIPKEHTLLCSQSVFYSSEASLPAAISLIAGEVHATIRDETTPHFHLLSNPTLFAIFMPYVSFSLYDVNFIEVCSVFEIIYFCTLFALESMIKSNALLLAPRVIPMI